MTDDCPIHTNSHYEERAPEGYGRVLVLAVSDNLNNLNDRSLRMVIFTPADAPRTDQTWHLSPKDVTARFALTPFTKASTTPTSPKQVGVVEALSSAN